MAKIVPFGDAQAHGSLCGSVSFRRFRGSVVFQKKPHPKQPNSAAQQVQKNKFKNAWGNYWKLLGWELSYLTEKATEIQSTKANLFMSENMITETPDDTPNNNIKKITAISLPGIIASETEGLKHKFIGLTDIGEVEQNLGHIWDKENIFSAGVTATPYDRCFIEISRPIFANLNIPANYPILIRWQDLADNDHYNIIRYPAFPMPYPDGLSRTPKTDMKTISSLNIVVPAGDENHHVIRTFKSSQNGIDFDITLAGIWDTENIISGQAPATPYNWLMTNVIISDTTPYTAPEGYKIEVGWTDFSDDPHNDDLIFPAEYFEYPGGEIYFIAEDFALYYDKEMENLAYSPLDPDEKLYIANDFSLYYDKEMTQLASVPYF